MEPGEPLSSSWLTRHHRTSHFANKRRPAVECEGLARDAQLNASFGRLSGRIGTAALCAPVAQRIERRFPKPCVGGSSPLRGARFSQFIDCFGGFSFFFHAHLRTLVTIWSQRGALSRPGDLLGMFHDGSQRSTACLSFPGMAWAYQLSVMLASACARRAWTVFTSIPLPSKRFRSIRQGLRARESSLLKRADGVRPCAAEARRVSYGVRCPGLSGSIVLEITRLASHGAPGFSFA